MLAKACPCLAPRLPSTHRPAVSIWLHQHLQLPKPAQQSEWPADVAAGAHVLRVFDRSSANVTDATRTRGLAPGTTPWHKCLCSTFYFASSRTADTARGHATSDRRRPWPWGSPSLSQTCNLRRRRTTANNGQHHSPRHLKHMLFLRRGVAYSAAGRLASFLPFCSSAMCGTAREG
ncbi:hypothetical protein CC86DRAFT_375494 [Ophiobolus disseminans]|uniref:Uncharacterized protein n=1 Tax=Ophiobolus disseminans TaxID=1469910 RepID=A0A6A6ZDS9_9PLEO|nr:hypothetical protein CC86DRAFT_375494 [Ophiobolus disseminans]